MPRFVDRVVIHARAGSGGNGCASVHREKFKPLGGPDGGNGGRGGSIVLVVDPQVHTLLDFHFRPHVVAASGKQGMGNNRDGAAGADLEVKVPDGTVVLDENGRLLADLVGAGTRFEAAAGGRGGLGNAALASRARKAPGLRAARREGRVPRPHPRTQDRRRRRPDRVSVGRQILAGVGDLGGQAEDRRLPVHHAGPQPGRGVGGGAHLHRRRRAGPDPGRVRRAAAWAWTSCGTSSGVRCWCTSSTAPPPEPGRDPISDIDALEAELAAYTPTLQGDSALVDLAERPRAVVLNKIDVPEARELAEFVRDEIAERGWPVFLVSTVDPGRIAAVDIWAAGTWSRPTTPRSRRWCRDGR